MNCIWRHQRRLQSWMITVWLERLLYDLLFAGFFHYLHDTNWMISNGSCCCCSFWIKSNISWIFLTDLFKRIPLAQTHNQSDLNGLKMYIRNASLTKIKNKNKMERRRWQVINKKTSFFACLYLIKRPSLLLSSELRKDS